MLKYLLKFALLGEKDKKGVLKLSLLLIVDVELFFGVGLDVNFELFPDSFDDLIHVSELALVLFFVLGEHFDVVGHRFLQGVDHLFL